MAKIKLRSAGDYRVKTKRYIAVGNVYRISPSNGYCDIDSGLVIVKLVGTQEDIRAKAGHEGTYFDLLRGHDFDSWELPETTVWVVYAYTRFENRQQGDVEHEGTFILPIEEFADHISRV